MNAIHQWAISTSWRIGADKCHAAPNCSRVVAARGRPTRLTCHFMLLLMSLSLSGCAVFQTVMIDEKGRQEMVSTSGWGIAGVPAAGALFLAERTNYRDRGYVTLSQFEAKEGPKVEQREGITIAPTNNPPSWRVGDAWTYQVTGASTGQFSEEIIGEETLAGVNAYVMRCSGDSVLYLDRSLNIMERRQHGQVEYSYLTPRRDYEWPLFVGKSWHAKGKVKTGTSESRYGRRVLVKNYGIVRVPAGEFEAYYILTTRAPYAGPSDGQEPRLLEVWYAPKLRHVVKRVVYDEDGWTIFELTHSTVLGAELHQPNEPQ